MGDGPRMPKSYGSCVHIYYLAHDFQLSQDSIDGNAERLTPQSGSNAKWKKEVKGTNLCDLLVSADNSGEETKAV